MMPHDAEAGDICPSENDVSAATAIRSGRYSRVSQAHFSTVEVNLHAANYQPVAMIEPTDTDHEKALGELTPEQNTKSSTWKLGLFGGIAIISVVCFLVFRDQLSLQSLAQHESMLLDLKSERPLETYSLGFAIYVIVTGLSLPIAGPLTLVFGWYFGFAAGTILVSFASTLGATLAFLSSRYLLRDAIQARYGGALEVFQRRFADEGAFYLFTLRLIPAVPFAALNLVMGLTPIRVGTYWWVSQLGMLAGTAVYVYAGSRVPNLGVLAEDGVGAVFEPWQLLQFTVAFALLGLFPLIVRKAFSIKPRGPEPRF